MKNVLITGANSYVGTSVEKWLMKDPDNYYVETLDMQDPNWVNFDFTRFDVVFHVAGIAHIKETKENRVLYFKVNRDLAFDVAKKAKLSRIKQFIFMSSMSVYGLNSGIICDDTPLKPITNYGISKKEAEDLIESLKDTSFCVGIIRPPMIYGKDCKGNYIKLSNIALRLRIFPKVNNTRSMIYIDNLSEFIKIVIDMQIDGVFKPQNSEYVNTSELVREIALIHGKHVVLTKLFNPFIKIFKLGVILKVFGDLYYDNKYSLFELNYNKIDFLESIKLTEEIQHD